MTEIKHSKKKAIEAEAPINDSGTPTGLADSVHPDGGSGNCPEGETFDAETETCKKVEGDGAIVPEAPTTVQGLTTLSDGGKSGGESLRRRTVPTRRRVIQRKARESQRFVGASGANRDIKHERKRTLEYLKKLDRIEAIRSLKVSDARIAAKEKYLKEKRLDQLIRNAKEGARPRASIVPRAQVKVGESLQSKPKYNAVEMQIRGPASWVKAVASGQNVPASYMWKVNKQNAWESGNQRFIKSFDGNDNTQYTPLTKDQIKAGEALSVAGPVSTDFMRIMSEQVLVLPSGKVVTPIRQFCETKVLPPGTREAFFYDFGTVDFSAITEDVEITASTPDIRSQGGEALPRGSLLRLGYTQLETSPIDIIAAANRSFALESVNDESKEVLDVAYGDDTAGSGDATNRKAKGGGVKDGFWVDHAGTQITTDASGLANLQFAGLVAAKGVIEDQGLDPSNIITYTTGKAIRDLIFDPDLDSFISFSRPAIITEATVERIAGTNVVRSSALPAGGQASSFQSAMFIPNIAFGLVTGRDLTMEAQRRNELQVVLLSGTQRVTGFVKNVEATCRLSHT